MRANQANQPTVMQAVLLTPLKRAEYVHLRHRHDVPELLYVLRGEYTPFVGDEQWPSVPGDVFCYPPGMLHGAGLRYDGSATIHVVQWRPAAGDAWPEAPARVHDSHGRLLALFGWLTDLWEYNRAEIAEASPILQALLAGFRLLARGCDHPSDPIERARHYLDRELHDPHLSLAQVAKLVGMSPTHFCHRFTAQVGMPPMRYLSVARIRAAQVFASTTDLPIHEIAHRVGVLEPSQLRRLVRRHLGRSLSEVRASAEGPAGGST
jgi:AraC-like DNA-binding protein/quercetin dioxygenase-like cupin family protein